MRKSHFGYVLSLALLLSLGGGVGAQPPLTVISGATLIDGRGGAPLRDAVIVIAGNRIQAVGPRSAVQAPAGATVIDAAGKFVVPGLFDTHVHYYHWAAALMLHYGITSILDIGNDPEWILAVREGTAKGKVFGPRIFAVGPLIGAPPSGAPGCCGGISRVVVNNPAEATKVARALIGMGVDGLKLIQGTSAVPRAMRPDLIAVVSAEARQAGISVWGDLSHRVVNAREAVSAGLNVIVHSQGLAMSTIKDPAKLAAFKAAPDFLNTGASPAVRGSAERWDLTDPADYDDLVRFLVERKVVIQPTSQYLWMGIHPLTAQHAEETRQLGLDPGLSYLPPSARTSFTRRIDDGGRMEDLAPQLTQLRQGYEKFKQFHKKFFAAGGVLIPATDMVAQGLAGLGLHNELELLGVEEGLSPLQAITAATKHSAEAVGKGDRLGTIEAGKLADLLIVKQDPLVDIRNLRNSLETVMQDGKVIDRTFHPNFTSPYPRRQPDLGAAAPPYAMISPVVVPEGSASFTLVVTPLTTGLNLLPRVGEAMFAPGATVKFNGQDLTTEFVNERELRAQVPANLVAKQGMYPITVRDRQPSLPETFPATIIVKFK